MTPPESASSTRENRPQGPYDHDYYDMKACEIQELSTQTVADRLSVERKRHALETEMQNIQAQQCDFEEQQHLLIEKQCTENKQSRKEKQQVLAQKKREECVQKAEVNKELNIHLSLSSE